MNRKVWTLFAGIVLLVASTTGSSFAASYTFNFNSSTLTGSNTNTDTKLSTYMSGVLSGTGVSLTSVTGAKDGGTYNGDGFVTGPCSGSPVTCKSTTLGSDEGVAAGGTDHFLITEQTGGIDAIMMQFSGVSLYSVTFDLEIFPDGTGSTPDFSLFLGNNGVKPATTSLYVKSTAPSNAHSPNSGSGAFETNPQTLMESVTVTSSSAFNTIWFQDWPATIGIDNVTISTTKPQVPEPASIMLLGSGFLAVLRRRKAK